MSKNNIQHASVHWNEQGNPMSEHFDDIYFSNDDGLEETRYVFLQGNGLPSRFETHPRRHFVVAESGFGTGLNFLTLWQAFSQFKKQSPNARLQRLHFVSFEKYPLTLDDVTQAHRRWPQLAQYADELRTQWPDAIPGCHRLILAEGSITLDLWYGDINQLMPTLDNSLTQAVDAWFLDGFSPSKNPDMWSDELFSNMVKLAHPQGTFATFTAAGFVRRGLSKAGFDVTRAKGFAHKREMLCGIRHPDTPLNAHQSPWYHRPPLTLLDDNKTPDIAIIGGGIASALTALSLLRRGAKVTLYCADTQAAMGASGNQQGAVYPLLNGQQNALERFFLQAFPFARRQYDALAQQGVLFDHSWCGVTQLAYDEKSAQKIEQILKACWPDSMTLAMDENAVNQGSGKEINLSGVSYPQGGWLAPAQLTKAVIAFAQSKGLAVHYQHQLTALNYQFSDLSYQSSHLNTPDGQWHCQFSKGEQKCHDAVILAQGYQAAQQNESAELPMYAVRGQVSHIATNKDLSPLKQVLCYNGYLTPKNSAGTSHCIGASYVRESTETTYSQSEQQENRQRLIDCLPHSHWTHSVDISDNQARQSVRCATRDHLPILGAIPDKARTITAYQAFGLKQKRQTGIEQTALPLAPSEPNLYIIAALGARGLSSAPLLGEMLASQLFNEPLPADSDVMAALNPNRQWVRKLLKGRPITEK